MKQPIPSDWNGLDWCQWAICWPDSPLWRGILMGFITSIQRGRFWDERTGTITDIQITGREITARNIPLQESILACDGALQLAEAIRYLADRVYNKPCCGDTVNVNVVQGSTPGGNTSYGTQPGAVQPDPLGDPPEGFESWEEYWLYKCQVANLLADGIITSMGNLSLLTLVNTAGAAALIGAAMAGFIALPPAAIPVLIAALVALGLSLSILYAISEWLQDNRSDLVCALYNSESVAAAQDAFIELIDEALASLVVASSLHPVIRTIALILASTDTLNQLFDGTLQADYPNADCSGCNELECGPEVVLVDEGTLVSSTGDNNQLVLVVDGEYFADNNQTRITINIDQTEWPNCCFHIDNLELISGSLSSPYAQGVSCAGTFFNLNADLSWHIDKDFQWDKVGSAGSGSYRLRYTLTRVE